MSRKIVSLIVLFVLLAFIASAVSAVIHPPKRPVVTDVVVSDDSRVSFVIQHNKKRTYYYTVHVKWADGLQATHIVFNPGKHWLSEVAVPGMKMRVGAEWELSTRWSRWVDIPSHEPRCLACSTATPTP